MSDAVIKAALKSIAAGKSLSEADMEAVLGLMSEGHGSAAEMGALLMGLAVRGETAAEIAGAARHMRARMIRVEAPANAIDIVGTGGDGHNTYNVSTTAAFVAAGAGAVVAKHGNRSVSSLSGSADVLAALGIKVDAPLATLQRAMSEARIGFLWAPVHHPAMKAWAPIRADLGVRTLFNVLGPICNPASVRRQIVGVFKPDLAAIVADALRALGTTHAWVVHGHDGLDELSTTGPTSVAEIKDGTIRHFEVTPEEVGLPRARLADLTGGNAAANAASLLRVLQGEPGAYRDIVLMNAGAALVVAGLAKNLDDGIALARRSIDSGAAKDALDRLIAVTHAERP